VEVVLRKLTGDHTPEALPSARQTVIPSPDLAAEYPVIPREVQALLLKEGAAVTDLDMEDPLAFDSDVSAVYIGMRLQNSDGCLLATIPKTATMRG
jgi:hypothetical protein